MSLVFNSISALPMEELRKFPIKQLVDCVLEALPEQRSNDELAVFNFGFTNLIRLLDFEGVNEIVYLKILPSLKTIFDQTLANVIRQDDLMTHTSRLEAVLQLLFACVCNSIRQMEISQLDEYPLAVLGNLSIISLKILNRVLEAVTSEVLPTSVWNSCQPIQQKLTSIFQSNRFQMKSTVNDLQICRQVLEGFIELANQQSLRNDGPKPIANAWKLVSKLAKEFSNNYRSIGPNQANNNEQITDDSLNWLEFCVKTVCELIGTSIDRLLSESDDAKKKLQFKLNTFYAMFLHSLSELYSGEMFRGQKFFIEFAMLLNSFSCDESDINENIQSINKVCLNVLHNVYNCERFAVEVFASNRTRNIYVCKCICRLLLELPRMENDLYLGCADMPMEFNGNVNSGFRLIGNNILYYLIVVCVPQETAQLLSSPDLYEEIVEMSALLFLRAMSNESLFSIWENLLCQGLLDNDAIRGHLCLDIWRLFVRRLPNGTCLSYFDFWSENFNEFSSIPHHPRNIFVKQLIQTLFDTLTNDQKSTHLRNKIHDLNSLNALTPRQIAETSYRNLDEISQAAEMNINKIVNNSSAATIENLNELLSALSLLERSPGSNNVDSTTSLMQLYEKSKKADKNLILSKTLRALMLRKFISGNEMINLHPTNSDSDATICSELVTFAKNMDFLEQNQSAMKYSDLILMANEAAANQRCDLVTRVRLQNLSADADLQGSTNGVDDHSLDPLDYYENCFQDIHHCFGCSSKTSCSKEGSPIMADKFERSLKLVLQASQNLYSIYENCEKEETILRKYANEIYFVHNLFDQLKQKI